MALPSSGKRSDRDLVLWVFPFFMDAANTAHLQMTRIQENKVEDWNDAWPMQVCWYDWQTPITQLWRMRKLALLMCRASSVSGELRALIREFDKKIPKLKMCRDAIEHMDAYIIGVGTIQMLGWVA